MEISIKNKNSIKFKDISEGELLIYAGSVYLKIPTIDYYPKGEAISKKGNVIQLHYNIISSIEDDVDCELVNGTLQIER